MIELIAAMQKFEEYECVHRSHYRSHAIHQDVPVYPINPLTRNWIRQVNRRGARFEACFHAPARAASLGFDHPAS